MVIYHGWIRHLALLILTRSMDFSRILLGMSSHGRIDHNQLSSPINFWWLYWRGQRNRWTNMLIGRDNCPHSADDSLDWSVKSGSGCLIYYKLWPCQTQPLESTKRHWRVICGSLNWPLSWASAMSTYRCLDRKFIRRCFWLKSGSGCLSCFYLLLHFSHSKLYTVLAPIRRWRMEKKWG